MSIVIQTGLASPAAHCTLHVSKVNTDCLVAGHIQLLERDRDRGLGRQPQVAAGLPNTRLTQFWLSKYQRTVSRMPVSKV